MSGALTVVQGPARACACSLSCQVHKDRLAAELVRNADQAHPSLPTHPPPLAGISVVVMGAPILEDLDGFARLKAVPGDLVS